jgi:hypothetical protein
MWGKKQSEQSNILRSIANKGKSPASKGKVAHNKGIPAKKVACKHCSREIGVNAIGKHEKACKLNPNRCI